MIHVFPRFSIGFLDLSQAPFRHSLVAGGLAGASEANGQFGMMNDFKDPGRCNDLSKHNIYIYTYYI